MASKIFQGVVISLSLLMTNLSQYYMNNLEICKLCRACLELPLNWCSGFWMSEMVENFKIKTNQDFSNFKIWRSSFSPPLSYQKVNGMVKFWKILGILSLKHGYLPSSPA